MGRRNINKVEEKKNKKWKIIFIVMFVFAAFVYYQVYGLIKYTLGKSVRSDEIWMYKFVTSRINKNNETEDKEENLNIAFLGNILINEDITDEYTQKSGESTINNVFNNISFSSYDYVAASLNTNISSAEIETSKYYTTTKILSSLSDKNINLLMLANKEMALVSQSILNDNISAISSKKINYVGIDNKEDNYYIIDKNNVKVGVLAYVGDDYSGENNVCVYSESKLNKDIKNLNKKNVDLIVVFIDIQRNNCETASETKKETLKGILEQGVDIVISTDNVEQKLYKTAKSEGNSKYIKYSLGDLIGEQLEEGADVSSILEIKITKSVNNNKSEVSYSVNDEKKLVALSNEKKTKYKIVNLDKEIESYNENTSSITQAEFNYLKSIKKNYNN